MAKKKKDEEPIAPQPAAKAGDAVASDLFGGALFRPVGETLSTIANNMGSAPNPAMMAGAAGANPLVSSGVPSFPSRLGPLISTNYGLPPSERPDWRDPSAQWDAPKPPQPYVPFTGNAATAAAKQYEGLPTHIQASIDRMNMSPQTLGVVNAAQNPLSGINAPINTSIQGMSVNRDPINVGPSARNPQNLQSFSQQPSFNLSSSIQNPVVAAQPQPLQPLAQNIPQAVRPALTKLTLPSGEAWVTAEQRKNFQTATARQEQEKQTRAENMAKFEQALPELRAKAKEATKLRDEESLRRFYSFQQRKADEVSARETAKAQAEQARGGSGRDALRRAQRFEVEANLAEQRGALVGKTVENPITKKTEPARAPFFSWETIKTKNNEEYLPSGIGNFIKISGPSSPFSSPYSSKASENIEGFSQSAFAPPWMRGRKRFYNFGTT